MAIVYRAIFIPDEPRDGRDDREGFASTEEAEAYIRSKFCGACSVYWQDEPMRSGCAAEWLIEAYDTETQPSEEFRVSS